MRLCDRICEIAAAGRPARSEAGYHLDPDAALFEETRDLGSAAILAPRIRQAPLRYILTPEVAVASWRIVLSMTETLNRAIDLIRLPAPLVWFEWPDRIRREILAELGRSTGLNKFEGYPEQVGVLVEATDDSGRRGRARWAWRMTDLPDDISCQASMLEMYFDLDDPDLYENVRLTVPRIIGMQPKEGEEALVPLLRRQVYVIAHDFETRIRELGLPFHGPETDEFVKQVGKDLGGEGHNLFAILMLLMARNAVTTRPSNLTKINRARRKRGRIELLDHVEVDMSLSRVQRRRHDLGAGAGHRPTRLHMVSGHLKVRKSGIYWWRPHLRGDASKGVVASRSVTLKP